MSNPLDYTAPPKLLRSKFFRRGTIVTCVMLALTVTAFLCRGWLTEQFQMMRLANAQEACLNDLPTPGEVIYTEDAAAIARLGGKSDHIAVSSSIDSTGWRLEYLVKMNRNWYMYVDQGCKLNPWMTVLPAPEIAVMAYLHRLKTPSGEEYLAAVELTRKSADSASFESRIIPPVRTHLPPGISPDHYQLFTLVTAPNLPGKPSLNLFGGSATTPDGMNFIIPYDIAGIAGHIKGQYIQDPTLPAIPQLTLEIVDGPLKP